MSAVNEKAWENFLISPSIINIIRGDKISKRALFLEVHPPQDQKLNHDEAFVGKTIVENHNNSRN